MCLRVSALPRLMEAGCWESGEPAECGWEARGGGGAGGTEVPRHGPWPGLISQQSPCTGMDRWVSGQGANEDEEETKERKEPQSGWRSEGPRPR